jgi:hypothetical protein
MVRQILATFCVAAGLVVSSGAASAEPVSRSCTASFAQSELLGAFASADLTDAALDRLYVEMGPARAAMTTKGPGVSGAYTTKAPDLTMWTYLSIYQPAKEWLTLGSVRLDYSGFRLGWPEFRSGGKIIKKLKLTVTQGTQSITVDAGVDGKGAPMRNQVFAIDFEAMLSGPYPVQRVGDHAAWRAMAGQSRPISVTLTDASNGKVIARGAAPAFLPADSQQTLLSGGLNALREKFKAGGCG